MSSIASSRQVGRFQLQDLVGQGAQSVVWRAWDPRLDRAVALKLHRALASGGEAVEEWLREARAVSRLSHPGIVPLFEADVHEQHPYLVFEFVEGRTLWHALREQGAWVPGEAVDLIICVLDALAHAHQAGVVHRDLKPSNVLLDREGRARVMDFGIAISQRHGFADKALVGTPAYLAPEVTQGRPPTPQVDVYAAGLVLYEMLCGRPAVADPDPYRAIYRHVHEDVRLPAELPYPVDDGLRAIVHRATARDPAVRYASARELGEALRAWRRPAVAAEAQGGHATLEFLLRRMRHKGDFPALSDAVARIQRIASSEHESLQRLAEEILKDVALTNKLLRLVNSASFRGHGAGAISTVSRAVALIGFAGIRNLALSLVLLEHMQDRAQAGVLKEEFLRALMAGTVAAQLSRAARDAEESFIAAVFQNLGRLLAEFYFPEEARQIRQRVQAASAPGALEREAAAVLGLSYEELGVGVARAWGLPEALQRAMRKLADEPPSRSTHDPGHAIRCVASLANEATDLLLHTPPKEAPERLQALAHRYAPALGIDARALSHAVQAAREEMALLAPALKLQPQAGTPAARLLPSGPATVQEDADSLSPLQLEALVRSQPTPAEDPAQVLAAGIQDITNTMVENFRLDQVLRMILETMYRALGFRRVVFCLRDVRSGVLTGRFGLGEGAAELAPRFRIEVAAPDDLFAAVAIKGVDTLISDVSQGQLRQRLPAWYCTHVDAPTFLLLPLQLKQAPLGLIYADKSQAGEIRLGEGELALLRTLRNQAVMAFKQAA
ncbi:serine/threonine protein kinase [Caldimonas aquatica]|uniref:HDOD domain-containing protein n=1 Tax=Caldimonas aquatica TaxID=376175 RepID=A0ABY6MMS9_9BURK|nr:serine/threonine protein kinase [Schlegelella aquatica]UZD53809.1 HDOD domain-containing protein [Schlegelella aquatica]